MKLLYLLFGILVNEGGDNLPYLHEDEWHMDQKYLAKSFRIVILCMEIKIYIMQMKSIKNKKINLEKRIINKDACPKK
jgi:hypothetical protein